MRYLLIASFLTTPAAAQVSYDCVIEPAQTVEIASPESGLVEEVPVRRGDVVAAGDVLARLESRVEETTISLLEERAVSDAEIVAQQARLNLTESQRARAQTLVERNIGAANDLEEAEASVEVALGDLSLAQMRKRIAELELERARETLERRTIHSPIDGIVVETNLSAGEYADPNSPVLQLAQIDPLHVQVFLPVSVFGEVEVGAEATIVTPPPLEGSHVGTISVIDRVFDAASGTFGLQIDLANPNHEIPAGLRCLVEF
ncbi:efflux RND transporter periplasmic adaptor subunit [Pelagovum pacificum]|uniref:Efflux RND transporter periplasmic adaptor subunit n=1 Tax=Pelagovum pacificum TaxID=2588711 RepID=A0A5C5GAK2_9RHOB|nr:efflux RND transporter periplasmic adaptor subunit [Pelagovum pacificum]QQA41434.1 efflux RND transporter periplasmic adaptor subunit [Pelagovum pacificum]TNY31763.1 efflux RND transporter periplasmic adaptor subunit [Pelagovum pacificum]